MEEECKTARRACMCAYAFACVALNRPEAIRNIFCTWTNIIGYAHSHTHEHTMYHYIVYIFRDFSTCNVLHVPKCVPATGPVYACMRVGPYYLYIIIISDNHKTKQMHKNGISEEIALECCAYSLL